MNRPPRTRLRRSAAPAAVPLSSPALPDLILVPLFVERGEADQLEDVVGPDQRVLVDHTVVIELRIGRKEGAHLLPRGDQIVPEVRRKPAPTGLRERRVAGADEAAAGEDLAHEGRRKSVAQGEWDLQPG